MAAEGGALTLGGVSQCPTYLSGAGKQEVQAEFRKQIQVFVEADLDFLLCEVLCDPPAIFCVLIGWFLCLSAMQPTSQFFTPPALLLFIHS